MAKQTPIINFAGNYEETIVRLAKHLGRDKIRRKVFNEIYGRARKPRSIKQIMAAAEIPDAGTNVQQVQNALKDLAKYHLISRQDNCGQTDDGCRFVYGKEESISAHKAKIIQFADNPREADRVPTMRKPALSKVSPVRSVQKRELKQKKKLKVLYLAASPDETKHLRVDAEIRRVQEAIRGSKFRDNISVEFRPAAGLQSLVDGLNDHRPQIVHFSGHGDDQVIAADTGNVDRAETQILSFETLGRALGATDTPPEIVVLNSCNSTGARPILLNTVKILVLMKDTITDFSAAAFATQFYAAIASGQSIQAAFDQGTLAAEAVMIGEGDTPKLFSASGIEPKKFILT